MDSHQPAAPLNGLRISLVATKGRLRGKVFRIKSNICRIGRDPSNDIVIPDAKISRSHAEIEFVTDGITLRDLDSSGGTYVNGEKISEHFIEVGQSILIGETEFLVRKDASVAISEEDTSHLRLSNQGLSPISQLTSIPTPTAYSQATRSENSSATSNGSLFENKRFRFYAIVLSLVGLVAFIIYNNSQSEQKKIKLRTTQEIESSIQLTEERLSALDKKKQAKSAEESTRSEQSEAHFLQGFRDYNQNIFARAIRSFETATAIDPNNNLAKRYLSITIRKRDEFVEKHISDARLYRERGMYPRCIASLDLALKVMDDPTNMKDVRVKELVTLKRECEVLKHERF